MAKLDSNSYINFLVAWEGFLKSDPIRLQNCQFFVQFFIGYQIRIHSDF